MVFEQVIVLLNNVGDFRRCKTLSQDFGLSLNFLHQVRVFTDNLANFAL